MRSVNSLADSVDFLSCSGLLTQVEDCDAGECIGKLSSTIFSIAIIQWNLRIKDTLGQGVLSFIERFPLFGG